MVWTFWFILYTLYICDFYSTLNFLWLFFRLRWILNKITLNETHVNPTWVRYNIFTSPKGQPSISLPISFCYSPQIYTDGHRFFNSCLIFLINKKLNSLYSESRTYPLRIFIKLFSYNTHLFIIIINILYNNNTSPYPC